jgi:hypothetical protein
LKHIPLFLNILVQRDLVNLTLSFIVNAMSKVVLDESLESWIDSLILFAAVDGCLFWYAVDHILFWITQNV